MQSTGPCQEVTAPGCYLLRNSYSLWLWIKIQIKTENTTILRYLPGVGRDYFQVPMKQKAECYLLPHIYASPIKRGSQEGTCSRYFIAVHSTQEHWGYVAPPLLWASAYTFPWTHPAGSGAEHNLWDGLSVRVRLSLGQWPVWQRIQYWDGFLAGFGLWHPGTESVSSVSWAASIRKLCKWPWSCNIRSCLSRSILVQSGCWVPCRYNYWYTISFYCLSGNDKL